MRRLILLTALFQLCFYQTNAQQNLKQTINTNWLFYKGELNTSSLGDKSTKWENINIPHSWNDQDVMDDNYGYYKGIGWYKKRVFINPSWKDKRVTIYFEGANQVTEVYVNGKKAGRHIGGYTAFSFDITPFLNVNNEAGDELIIKVDNSYTEDIPPYSGDFTFYGGIYRDLYLCADESIHFDNDNYASAGVFITTPIVSASQARVNLKGKIKNTKATQQDVTVLTSVYDAHGKQIVKTSRSVKLSSGGKTDFSVDLPPIEKPHLWSPENPYLYRVVSTIISKSGIQIDEFSNPLGLRWFSFEGEKGFFLNGTSLKLVGANRHQDYKDMANALPDALHTRDMKLIKEMGGNFVRISHYPQDPAVLEACDRLGILAMVETPQINRITQTEAYAKNALEMQKEMIRQNFNHPSIILWGYMNEILLDPRYPSGSAERQKYISELVQLAVKIEALTRKEDPYRYTIIPAHGDFKAYHNAGLTKIPMVMGWNLYYGWYTGNFEGLDDFLEEHHKQLPEKPLIITEFGADADRKLHSDQPEKFDKSMEYAVRYHKYYLDVILKNRFVAGGAIWNLIEFSSEIRDESWPHMNYKGIMSWDRVAKDPWYMYQAQLSKKEVVSIGSKDWNVRTGVLKADTDSAYSQPVELFSNQDEVQLFVNGKDLGAKKVVNASVTFEVPFMDGKNTLRAVVPGKPHIEDFAEIDFKLQSPDLKSSRHPFSDIRINLGDKRQYTDVLLHQSWLADQPYQKKGWGYVGGEPYKMPGSPLSPYGTKKLIKGTDIDPVYQTQRQGLSSYHFDVEDGEYELTLHFCEFVTGNNKPAIAYNLTEREIKESKTTRAFDVKINGEYFLENLSNENYLQPEQAIAFKTKVTVAASKGISIDFIKKIGEPILNGVELIRIF